MMNIILCLLGKGKKGKLEAFEVCCLDSLEKKGGTKNLRESMCNFVFFKNNW